MSQTNNTQTAPASTGTQAVSIEAVEALVDAAAKAAERLGVSIDQFVALGISSILSGLEGCDADEAAEFAAEARRLA